MQYESILLSLELRPSEKICALTGKRSPEPSNVTESHPEERRDLSIGSQLITKSSRSKALADVVFQVLDDEAKI